MPLFDFIKKASEGATGGLLKGASAIISNFIADPTEKLKAENALAELGIKHEEEMAKIKIDADKLELEEKESLLKDTQDARSANARIQESDKAGWLAKNIAYCLDIFVLLVWGFLTVYLICVMLAIVKKQQGVDYTSVTAIWGGVTAFASQIINFHRGTSASSKANGDAVRDMLKKTGT